MIVSENIKLFENPDEISLPNMEYNKYGESLNNSDGESPHFSDNDAYPFWINDEGSVIVGKLRYVHPGTRRDEEKYPGRIWLDRKMISFWEYPDKKTFDWMMSEIEELFQIKGKEINILENPEWMVEIIPNNMGWRDSAEIFTTEFITPDQYGGDYKRTSSELKKDHMKSPMEKIEIHRPKIGGSKKYGIQKPLAFRQKLVPESVNEIQRFERGQDPKKTIGIGIEALKEKIKKDIEFEIQSFGSKKTGSKSEIIFDITALSDLWETGGESIKGAIKLLAIEISGLPKIYRSRKTNNERFFKILKDSGLLWDKKYGWINAGTLPMAKRLDPEMAKEYAGSANPNQLFTVALKSHDFEGMKKAIKNGATNVTIQNNEAISSAAENNQLDLVDILLGFSEVDPGENTKEGKRYNANDRQRGVRWAAKNGHYDIVKRMMQDERVDPSEKNNYALSNAIKNDDKLMIDLLLTDRRVVSRITSMPKTVQKRLEKL